MVAQHEEVFVAQIGLQARLFLGPEGHAFVGMVGQRAEYKGGLLRYRQHAARLRAHRHASARVRVQHAMRIVSGFMHSAVNHKTRRIHRKRRVHEFVALHVYLHQAGSRDFVKHQSIRVDQEMVLRPRQPGRDVGEHQIAPAIQRHQPVASRQITAQLPFFGADLGFHGRDGQSRHIKSPEHCCKRDQTIKPGFLGSNPAVAHVKYVRDAIKSIANQKASRKGIINAIFSCFLI